MRKQFSLPPRDDYKQKIKIKGVENEGSQYKFCECLFRLKHVFTCYTNKLYTYVGTSEKWLTLSTEKCVVRTCVDGFFLSKSIVFTRQWTLIKTITQQCFCDLAAYDGVGVRRFWKCGKANIHIIVTYYSKRPLADC